MKSVWYVFCLFLALSIESGLLFLLNLVYWHSCNSAHYLAFLALLNRSVMCRDYAIPTCCIVRLHRSRCSHRNHQLFVQTLSPLKFSFKFYVNHPGVGHYQSYGNYEGR